MFDHKYGFVVANLSNVATAYFFAGKKRGNARYYSAEQGGGRIKVYANLATATRAAAALGGVVLPAHHIVPGPLSVVQIAELAAVRVAS